MSHAYPIPDMYVKCEIQILYKCIRIFQLFSILLHVSITY